MRFKIQIEFDKILIADVPKDKVSIGRSEDNDIVIPSSSVSRNHCEIQKEDKKYFLTDFGSYNGTYVDGIRIEPNLKKEFQKSALLTIGKVNVQVTKEPDPSSKEIHDNPTGSLSKDHKNGVAIKAGRLELHQPSLTLMLEKDKKIKGPKNPASEHFKSSYTKPNNAIFSYLFLLLLLGLAGTLYYFFLT